MPSQETDRTDAAPADAPAAVTVETAAADPLGMLREKLTQLAAGCLCVPAEKVGPDTELTRIGLESVLAVEFVSLVNAEFGADLTVRALREHPTVAKLAAYVSERG
jgi:acyl carrier protein